MTSFSLLRVKLILAGDGIAREIETAAGNLLISSIAERDNIDEGDRSMRGRRRGAAAGGLGAHRLVRERLGDGSVRLLALRAVSRGEQQPALPILSEVLPGTTISFVFLSNDIPLCNGALTLSRSHGIRHL